ncbi:uncharacterized protein LOC122264626 [Penaeus japonicus]|uniref:uncharacterized protein LOC122264626 n=1 Tax=Penaeus japonicus TaxID=27405 RepID=UPI001C7120E1|nr:uncharacterized protein LOC122264626 [Penaeus japonicus]
MTPSEEDGAPSFDSLYLGSGKTLSARKDSQLVRILTDMLKEGRDRKVIPGESVAKQLQVVTGKMRLKSRRRREVKVEPKIKWWRLREKDFGAKFKLEVDQKMKWEEDNTWVDLSNVLRETAMELLGVTTGKKKDEKETWCWNEEVQEAIPRKKEAWKEWHKRKDLRRKFLYKEAKNKPKVAVAKAKNEASEEIYEKLDTKEGET